MLGRTKFYKSWNYNNPVGLDTIKWHITQTIGHQPREMNGMRKKGKMLVMAGFILLLFSAPPLVLMGQELVLERKVQQQSSMDRIYVNFLELGKVEILGRGASIPVTNVSVRNQIEAAGEIREPLSYYDFYSYLDAVRAESIRYSREYAWENNLIRVEDLVGPGVHDSNSRSQSPLRITINHKDWTVTSPVEVRPYYLDENRYHGYFGLLTTKQNGREQLILVQRVSDIEDFNVHNLAWRVLTITTDGHVKEERFRYTERADDPLRVKFIQLSSASPISIGYRSNILHVWPSLWFPVLYPWATGGLGFLLVVIGGIVLQKKPKCSNLYRRTDQ